MAVKNILVIAIDGLRASALGAYGNTTYPTPALDELAAQSFLLDSCFADTCDLSAIYRELWQAQHPLRPTIASTNTQALPSQLAEAGYATTLVTDDPQVASFPAAALFGDRINVPLLARKRATDISQTAIAQVFAEVSVQVEAAASLRGPAPPQARFIWVHAQGLYGAWDAPLDLQERLLEFEEGDPSPRQSIDPPDFRLSAHGDPDATFVASCGYAGQVMAIDACLESLWLSIAETNATDHWLILLIGVRGYSLGEHGLVGGNDDRLYGEAQQVPMVWRFPDGRGMLARSNSLASPIDVLETLLAWATDEHNVRPRGDGINLLRLLTSGDNPWRDALVSTTGGGRRVIRTADWCLHCLRSSTVPSDARPLLQHEPDSEPQFELYVRPDDRWEANDVAALCPNVIEELSGRLRQMDNQLHSGEPLSENPHR